MARSEKSGTLQLILADGSVYDQRGKFDFIDREIDPTTGAILVQASFPNPDEIIRPGQFGKIKTKVFEDSNGIKIPQRCVIELQGTYSVFVVKKDNTIEKRMIQTGPKEDNFWIIQDGLQPGEMVVYEGLQQVREGLTVSPEVQDIKPITSVDTF